MSAKRFTTPIVMTKAKADPAGPARDLSLRSCFIPVSIIVAPHDGTETTSEAGPPAAPHGIGRHGLAPLAPRSAGARPLRDPVARSRSDRGVDADDASDSGRHRLRA